jgi:archaellum biogenesis ATPase FlaH
MSMGKNRAGGERKNVIETYKFDPEVQMDILRLMAQDSSFIRAATRLVKPEYFTEDIFRRTASFLLSFYEEYQVAPTLGQCRTELSTDYKMQSKGWEEFRDNIESFYKDLPNSKEYTVEKVSKFARAQAIRQGIMESLDYLNKGDLDTVVDIMTSATSAGVIADHAGYWYFETLEERVRRRKDVEFQAEEIIPTGVMEFDKLIRLQGVGRGEIGLVIAPTNGGKSIFLGQAARRAVYDQKNVAFLSFEMSAEKVADRLDAGFSKVRMADLIKEEKKILRSISKRRVSSRRRFWIGRFPTRGATLDDVRAALEELKTIENWKPDLIVLDYAGIVKPTRNRSEFHLELKEILEDFRGLCIEYNAAGWTAAQANRLGAGAELVRGTHVAGSWDSLGICDYIITVSITDQEREENILRLFLEKNRDGIAKVEIGPLYSDFERMCIVDNLRGLAPRISIKDNDPTDIKTSSFGKRYTLEK